MIDIHLRDATDVDFADIVALNAHEVGHTSAMDESRLRELHALASYHKVVAVEGKVAAFLLAMESGCGYANPNFEWFEANVDGFLYVDRIVVAAAHQGLKLGTRLYEDLFQQARTRGFHAVTCEYNLVPPNEPSRRFHDKFGFHEIGTQWLHSDIEQAALKHVSLQRAWTAGTASAI